MCTTSSLAASSSLIKHPSIPARQTLSQWWWLPDGVGKTRNYFNFPIFSKAALFSNFPRSSAICQPSARLMLPLASKIITRVRRRRTLSDNILNIQVIQWLLLDIVCRWGFKRVFHRLHQRRRFHRPKVVNLLNGLSSRNRLKWL